MEVNPNWEFYYIYIVVNLKKYKYKHMVLWMNKMITTW